jgi:hypothetical protein
MQPKQVEHDWVLQVEGSVARIGAVKGGDLR